MYKGFQLAQSIIETIFPQSIIETIFPQSIIEIVFSLLPLCA
jgi:hypothetical protein